MPGPADALQAAGDRLRRLDLNHEVDRAHVDSQLEARRRDEAGDATGLEILLDELALLAGERAVVRSRDLLLGKLVEAQSEPLGEAPVVDEDDRRTVRAHEPQDLGVDRRPDRARVALGADVHLLPVGRRRMGERAGRVELAHVVDRHHHLEVELLPGAGVDERDRPSAADEPSDLLERPLRRGQPDPLDRPVRQCIQALDAERKMRAALGAGDRVHLVKDQRLDRAQACRAPAT